MSATDKFIAQKIQHHVLHLQTGLSNAASNTYQTQQGYVIDLHPSDGGKKNKFDSMALCLSVLANDALVGVNADEDDVLGCDIELSQSEDGVGGWEVVSLSDMLGSGYLGAPAEYDLAGNVIKLSGVVGDDNGSVIEARVNVEVSRLKRYLRCRIRPQFNGSSVTTAAIVVLGVLGAPQEAPTARVNEYKA